VLTKRIIPCLDVKDGRTVKGVNFENLRDAGDAVELAARYAQEGADELVFLDITATNEKRKTMRDLVRRVAREINIPFTVGGGISSVEDVSTLLENGVDKISINSSAFKRPELITDLANRFGSQCIVLAVDTKFESGDWYVYLNGGKLRTEMKTMQWVKEATDRGAGEILLTSMNNDGTKDGFACSITRAVSESVSIPVIASGGAGTPAHFLEAFRDGYADAALAATVFHFGEIKIPELKKILSENQISMRLNSFS
jgi:imidazole glycerol-phosphate synthase subunit HisF